MIRSAAVLFGSMFLASTSIALAQTEPPAPPSPAPAEQSSPAPSTTDLGFNAALAPYGTWTTLAPFGEVWVPHGMPAGWRPYTTGHWAFTNAVGWTWVADEPWGWATFHYGRWTLDPALGWVWVPGNVWAPAWVAWRECDDFVGWAPLPPSVTWTAGVGLAFASADWMLSLGVGWWSFVPVRHLCHSHVCDVLVVRERVPVILHDSRVVERGIRLENGRPVNRAIAVERVEKASGEPVQRFALRDIALPRNLRSASVRPNEVAMDRPPARPRTLTLRPPVQAPEPRPQAGTAREVDRSSVRSAPERREPRGDHHHERHEPRHERPEKERH